MPPMIGIGRLRLLQQKKSYSSWKPCIGIEIHAQLNTDKKLFSEAECKWDAAPNSTFSHFDAAIPGTFPKLNFECVILALRAAILMNCKIADTLQFDRKHYDYFDLPAGYQITQHRRPLAANGWISLGQDRKIGIKQIHLEQDSAKSIHSDSSRVLVDLNRAGAGLIEIVSEPEIESAAEAASLVDKIHKLLQDTKVCSGLLEQGAMRVDVNVNLIESISGKTITPRVELKNVNGIKLIEDAVNCELRRQRTTSIEYLTSETRIYVPNDDITYPLRSKETTTSYRYLPEYDITIQQISKELVEKVRTEMPKTRQQLVADWMEKYPQLKTDILARLWAHPKLPEFFAALIRNGNGLDVESTLNWMVGDFLGVLNKYPGSEFCISVAKCLELLKALQSQKINKAQAKSILFAAIQNGSDLVIIEQTTQSLDLDQDIDALFHEYPDRVKYLQSQPSLKKGSLDFFIGRILKKHRGVVSVPRITELLSQKLYNKPLA